MFAGPAPSKAEVKAMEESANSTIKGTLATCLILYLSPHVIDYVRKLV